MTRDGRRTSTGSEWADRTSEEKERFFREEWTSLKEQTAPARLRFAPLLAPLNFIGWLCKYPFRTALKRLNAWFHTWPLFIVIAFWVTVGLSALTGLFGLWAYNSATANSPTGSPQAIKKACFDAADGFVANLQCVWKTAGAGPDTYEAMKLALAVIGGIGGVAFLVIKYRTRASQEREEARADRREAEAKLVAAVEQLGSEFPQVRIAGVYALADVADAYLGDYKQRVVNILCGYLRTKRGKFVEPKPDTDMVEDADVKTGGAEAPRVYESDDGPVESTILEVFASHLRKQDPADTKASTAEAIPSWSECKFDLHGACFIEPLNFEFKIFIGGITFKECHFAREVGFSGSTFTGWAGFEGSTFTGRVGFEGSTFTGGAAFDGSTFTGRVGFEGSTFTGWTTFEGSTFESGASFNRSTFESRVTFDRSTFESGVGFEGSTFTGGAGFYGSTFESGVAFDDSTFTGEASFDGSTFHDWANFDGSTFTGEASFDGSTFNNWANFDGSTFTGGASFDHSAFNGGASFNRSTFNASASFHRSTFKRAASFDLSTFKRAASFDLSTFNRKEQSEYKALFRRSPFGRLPLDKNDLPNGARWDDEPVPSGDDTAPEDYPPDGDTALPDEH